MFQRFPEEIECEDERCESCDIVPEWGVLGEKDDTENDNHGESNRVFPENVPHHSEH